MRGLWTADEGREPVMLFSFRRTRFLWNWHRSFLRDFGWGSYWQVVIRDAWKYRIQRFPKLLVCWTCGHRWEYHSVNVAPEVCFYSTGGYDECERCDGVKDLWGYV